MFKMMKFLRLFLTLCAAQAAYQGEVCPSPCRCLLFEGLRSVYCNRTGIKTVPSGIPLDTQLLELSENNISYIAVNDLKGLNNLQELYLSSNGFTGKSIELGALDLPKLTTIDLSYNMYETVPKCLPRCICKLWIFNNNINVLKDDSFVNYTHLKYLDVSYNHMTSIEKGAFDPLFFLQTLYISFNNLKDGSFPPAAFTKTVNLQVLSARFNSLQHMLKHLPLLLLHLDYVGNQIQTIPAYAFKELPNLQTLAFWQGKVTTIEDNAFAGLTNLTILDMNEDKVSSVITNKTFNGLTGLKTLYLYMNNIRKIEAGAFRSFVSLSELWFQSNKLTTLEPEVLNEGYIPKMSELYIDANPWYCDCHLRLLREKVDNASYVIQDPHLITCAGPEKVAGKAWDVLKPSDFVCPYKT